MKHADRQKDISFPLCVNFMRFKQRTHKRAKTV